MIAISMSLGSIAPMWVWGLAGGVVCLGLGFLLGRRGGAGGPAQPPPAALWDTIGRPAPDVIDDPGVAWEDALSQVQRLREIAVRVERVTLRATSMQTEFELLKRVLSSMGDGIVVLDRSERILYSNRTAQRVLQLENHESPGLEQAQASFEIIDGIRSVFHADLARKVKRRKVVWSEGDQERTFVIRCLLPVGDEALDSFIVVLEDHTAEEKASRAKTEFIYGISHELKTPLTSIQASLEMLVDEPDLPPEESQQLARLSLGETERLAQMVRELLDLARVEAGITEFKNEKVDLDEMFVSLHKLHLPVSDRKSIDLEWDVSDYLPMLKGDSRLLRQAFVNLVGNAIKYTKERGKVSVRAGLEGAELVVRVQDSGIGIAPEDVSKIFDKFFRAESAHKSKVQGTGLGLPMARYIIERHRGRIEVTSKLDQGSEFIVFMPVEADPDSSGMESALVAVDGVMS